MIDLYFDKLKNSINKLGGSEDRFKKYNTIIQRYSETWRYYHTLFHLKDVFENIDFIISKMDLAKKDVAVIYLAAAYHDIFYDPYSKINEKRSIQIMKQELSKCEIDNKYISLIGSMILDTAYGSNRLGGTLSDILSDADLSIFASDKDKFNEYENNIRLEYNHIPDDKYVLARQDVMNMFLVNDIYHTQIAYDAWHDNALDNLKKYTGKL